MRKAIFLALASCTGASLLAQVPAPANRTAKTIVADSLAALPAKNQKDFTAIMEGLIQTKGEAVGILADMNDSVNNVQVNYALAGLASYVSQSNQEEARLIFVNRIFDEIAQTKDLEVKKFYIRLLGVCARDEMVDKIAQLAADKDLQETVADTLIDIDTAKADQVLLSKLDSYSQELAAHIIGQAEIMGQEAKLIGWYPAADADTKKAIIYALAQTGSAASVELLLQASKEAKYDFDKLGAIERLTILLKRMAHSDAELVMLAAQELFSGAMAAGELQTMISAVDVILAVDAKKARPILIALALEENLLLRAGGLNLLVDYPDKSIYVDIAQAMEKSSDEVKKTIITYLGDNDAKGAAKIIEGYINSDNVALSKAAMIASAKIQSGPAIIKVLAKKMEESKNNDVINTAAHALSFTKYKRVDAIAYADALVDVVEKGTPHAQVKAIDLLAARGAGSSFASIAAKLNSPNQAIAQSAFKALASLVSAEHVDQILDLLKQAKPEHVASLQDALYSAMAELSEGQRASAFAAALAKMGDKKPLLYKIFTRLGDVNTFKLIAEGFNAASPADKALAIDAMSSWVGQPVFSYLTDTINASAQGDKVGLWHVYTTLVETQKMTKENKRIFAVNVLENSPDMPQKIRAARVIAETGSYLGMLAVAPFMDSADATMKEAASIAVLKIALGNENFNGPQVVELLKKCSATLRSSDAGYQRESIANHLKVIDHTGGYVPLFNGKDLSGWKGLVGNPLTRQQMTPDQLAKAQVEADKKMNAHWSVKNGSMYFNGHGDNICTDKQYGDFEMYVDWKLYKTGKEADAGIYLRGTPQVQIWDIRRTNVGAQVGSGGLYNNTKNPSKPLKVMDNELGEWNAFYIKMVGDRVTVVMNGETVVDNVVLENFWKRDIGIFVKEQIELQAHGSEVEYKNIYIRELNAPVAATKLSEQEAKEGFKLLFDGVSTKGWQGNTQAYVAEDGCIVMYPEKGHGNLYTDKEYSNFVLRFEFWLTSGANNGLGIRTPMNVDAAYEGMELQILDNDADIYKNLAPYQYHGSVYGVATAKRGHLKPLGEWNVQEVIADGNKIKVTLNGEVILETDIAEASQNNTKTLDDQPHPGLLNKKGFIGFLGHGSHVKFRNIRIKELPAK